MFELGELVIYGTRGVCEVVDIIRGGEAGLQKDRQYYVLTPYYEKKSRIFTPVDGNGTIMRPVLSREEAARLIDRIPDLEETWVSNDKMREELYKKAVRSCDGEQMIRIIKTLYLRKQDRLAQGKKAAAMDERYLNMAEEILYSELSISLELPREEMAAHINRRVQELKGEAAAIALTIV